MLPRRSFAVVVLRDHKPGFSFLLPFTRELGDAHRRAVKIVRDVSFTGSSVDGADERVGGDILETNLKKQGVVPLTFANEADYDKIAAGDEVSTVGLYEMLRNGGKGEVSLKVVKKDGGGEVVIPVRHAVSEDHAGFILAGSALNLLSRGL